MAARTRYRPRRARRPVDLSRLRYWGWVVFWVLSAAATLAWLMQWHP